MGVGVEHPLDLVDPDAQGAQGVEQVRPGVDEVYPALEHDHRGHAGPGVVPAVAVPGVHHREVLPGDEVVAQGEGRRVAGLGRQIQVHGDGLPFVLDLEDVHAQPPDVDALDQLHGLVRHHAAVQQLPGVPDVAEGELELQAHHFPRNVRRDSGGQDFFLGGQAVVAPADILHLGPHLVLGPHDEGFGSGIVGVAGDDHALAVEHLEDRKLGHVGEHAVLHRDVREEDGGGAGFVGNAA